jgi:hypothetical protein
MLTSSSTDAAISETSAPQSLLVRHIRAHVAKGDKARSKSDEHYIAAGLYLKTLKENYATDWASWETLLKARVGLSATRAGELMRIADGRESPQKIRAATVRRMRKLRASRISTSRDVESEERGASPDLDEKSEGAPAAAPEHRPEPINHPTPDLLIDSITNTEVVAAAADLLISGQRMSDMAAAMEGVQDLYSKLAKAGR